MSQPRTSSQTATVEPEIVEDIPPTEEVAASPAADTFAAQLAVLGFSPDELLGAIESLKAEKQAKAAAEAEARQQAETGYPKYLYNSKYSGESIQLPDSVNRLSFHRARLRVDNAEDEAFIKRVCTGRIFDQDMKAEKICDKCGDVYGSSEAYMIHRETHVP